MATTVAAANSSGEPASSKTGSKAKGPVDEAAVIGRFNFLRNEQRQVAGKIYELDNDLSEHKIVMDTLKTTDESRKCFRMIGGILVESTVKDVLPSLSNNAEQLKQAIETLNGKLIEKGKEILEFKEQNNISFQVPEKIVEESPQHAEQF